MDVAAKFGRKNLDVYSHLCACGKLLSQTSLKVLSCSVDLEVCVWNMLNWKLVNLQELFIFRLWWSKYLLYLRDFLSAVGIAVVRGTVLSSDKSVGKVPK